MKIVAAAAAFLVGATAVTAHADPFLVELPLNWTHGKDQKLRDTLDFTELETHQMPDAIYMVVDAKDEAFVETYFRASGAAGANITPIELVHQSMLISSASQERMDDTSVVVTWTLGEYVAPAHQIPSN